MQQLLASTCDVHALASGVTGQWMHLLHGIKVSSLSQIYLYSSYFALVWQLRLWYEPMQQLLASACDVMGQCMQYLHALTSDVHQPVTSLGNHMVAACTDCMGSKVSSLPRIYLYSSFFVLVWHLQLRYAATACIGLWCHRPMHALTAWDLQF
jgi:hypothetical protein